MIARRKIWLTALLLCILGTLMCIGFGVWLRGVGWHVEQTRPAPAQTRAAEGKLDEMRLILVGQIFFYTAAQFGHLMNREGRTPPRLVGMIYYLCVLNRASALAFVQFIQGKKQVTWKPRT